MARTIHHLAQIVRKQANILADKEVIHPKLAGSCGDVSFVLFDLLRREGYRVDFVSGFFIKRWTWEPHCWVTLWQGPGIGRNIDLTATQFGRFDPIFYSAVGDRRYRAQQYFSSRTKALAELDCWADKHVRNTIDKAVKGVLRELDNRLPC